MDETPGAALRRMRLEAGLPQKALAETLGISPQYMSDIESGSRTLPRHIISRMPPKIKSAVVAALKSEMQTKIDELDTQ
jgi:transcriptional regulator with XRE-family HTH domain